MTTTDPFARLRALRPGAVVCDLLDVLTNGDENEKYSALVALRVYGYTA